MTEYMFLIEVMVSEIRFEPSYGDMPSPQDMTITLTFADLMNSEIIVGKYPKQDFDINEEKRSVLLNIGKNVLFYSKTHSLISKLKQYPLEVSLKLKKTPIGSCKVPWRTDYINMINLFESIGFVKSVDFIGDIDLNDSKGNKVCTFYCYIRMTCCGDTLQTEIILPKDDNTNPIFVSCKHLSRIFCKGYDYTNTTIAPSTVFYKPVVTKMPTDFFDIPDAFEPPVIPMGSETGPGFQEMLGNQDNFDVISISFAPDDNRLYDFLSSMNEKQKHEDHDQKRETRDITKEVAFQMSTPVVEQQLCNQLECPGVKKFKEYGIGPLVKEKEYLEPKAPCTLSHANGRIENYGPEGRFIRPKKTDLPFVPPKNDYDDLEIRGRNIYKCSCKCPSLNGGDQSVACLRLRGGVSYTDEYQGFKSPFEECKSVMDQFDEILVAYKKALGPCGETTCPYSANIAEESCKKMCELRKEPQDPETVSCQSVPCNIDECPYAEKKQYPAGCGSPKCAYTKYKLGLVDDDAALELQFLPPAISGKCGHPKCDYPFQPALPPIHWDCPDPLPKGPCKNINCPFQPPDLQKLKLKQPTGPCGSPVCPYALPQPCDLPNCPFRRKPCPYSEQENKKVEGNSCSCIESDESACFEESNFKGKFADSIEPCTNPDCPAKPNGKKKVIICDIPCRDTDLCENPNCPIKKALKSQDICENPDCPFKKALDSNDISGTPDYLTKNAQKSKVICDNPNCPAKKSQKPKDICENPDCPAIRAQQTKDICDNPNCPAKKVQESNDICDNPNCPAKKNQQSRSICDSPNSPSAQEEEQDEEEGEEERVCENPNCPKKAKQQKAKNICGNPDCPFAIKKQKKNNVCGSPNCSFDSSTISEEEKCPKVSANCKEAEDICENPDCPYQKPVYDPICTDPFCPYVQALPSCGIPGCQFEPKPLVFCPSSNNPSKYPRERRSSRSSYNSNGSSQKQQIEETKQIQEEVESAPPELLSTSPPPPGTKLRKTSQPTPTTDKQIAKTTKSTKAEPEKPKKKRRGKFVYSIGDRYPGVKIGHRECINPYFKVPPKMGWLWNIPWPRSYRLKPRRGWRPGAIQKIIAARIRAHRQAQGLGMPAIPTFRGNSGLIDSDTEIKVVPRPTLKIQKKDGDYWITMNPLKDPKTLAQNEDPYMECTPLQFKISKNRNKERGDEQEGDGCFCEDEEKVSSSDSELDIEFTPPAGIIHPERFFKRKDVIHCDTQYDPGDFVEKKKSKKEKDKGGKGDGKAGKGKAGKAGKDGKGGKGGKGGKKGK